MELSLRPTGPERLLEAAAAELEDAVAAAAAAADDVEGEPDLMAEAATSRNRFLARPLLGRFGDEEEGRSSSSEGDSAAKREDEEQGESFRRLDLIILASLESAFLGLILGEISWLGLSLRLIEGGSSSPTAPRFRMSPRDRSIVITPASSGGDNTDGPASSGGDKTDGGSTDGLAKFNPDWPGAASSESLGLVLSSTILTTRGQEEEEGESKLLSTGESEERRSAGESDPRPVGGSGPRAVRSSSSISIAEVF